MKKQLLIIAILAGSFIVSANSFAMDSLDDNPAFLNTFFNERQEYLKEIPATEKEPEVNGAPQINTQKMVFDKWCDCKPLISSTNDKSTDTLSSDAKQIFKFYILSIILATFCHHLATH
ncbi:MAG: hypothetical protein ACOYT8_03695 [Candidatus Dependentiae bacterium]